jgi:hypothetical protein
MLIRVSRRMSAAEEGDYIGAVAWPGGKGSCRIRRETLGDQPECAVFGQESLAGMTGGPRSSVTEEERRG